MTVPRRVVLDMDVGIDDALALLYLAGRPDVEIVALGSVHGNVDTEQATRNALTVLDVAGLGDVPVAHGADRPLAQPLSVAAHVHGVDGIGDAGIDHVDRGPSGESAADQIVRLSVEQPGELDLLAVGPLTNLGLALQRDAGTLLRYRSVVIMGGSGEEPIHDAAMVGDANVFHDPEAADLVFGAGAATVMVGIAVCLTAQLDEPHQQAIRTSDQPHAIFAWRILQFYLDAYLGFTGRRVAPLYDPLAAGVLADPSLVVDSVDRPVGIVEYATGWRAAAPSHPSIEVSRRRPTRIVNTVEADRFVDEFTDVFTRPLPR